MKKFFSLSLALVGLAMFTASCEKDDTTDNNNNTPTEEGIQGEWYSAGTDVAPLLTMLFGTDSIYANFSTNMTYTVEQYDTTGAMLTLTGTYTQSESGVGSIWDIEVNQSAPAALVSAGIFEVSGTTMQYEIVQTSPDIGAVPPNATDGFGSTNNGTLGTLNVQTYQKL